jgi:hypothetical protein
MASGFWRSDKPAWSYARAFTGSQSVVSATVTLWGVIAFFTNANVLARISLRETSCRALPSRLGRSMQFSETSSRLLLPIVGRHAEMKMQERYFASPPSDYHRQTLVV